MNPDITTPIFDALPDEFGPINDQGFPNFIQYIGSNKLSNRKALISGCDSSSICKSVAILFAKEGADIVINYLKPDQKNAEQIKREIESIGKKCFLLVGNVGYENIAKDVATKAAQLLGGSIDILINNTSEQFLSPNLENLTSDQLVRTFRSNIFATVLLSKHALRFMPHGSTIINSTSVVAYNGSNDLLDYSAIKGATVSFTRSLAKQLVSRGIRVNAVSVPNISKNDSLMSRAVQPSEIATSYVFLACNESSQFTGQCLHPNGGEFING